MAEINVNLTTVDNLSVNYVLGEFNTNGAVGGVSGSIQYNNAGTLDGTANLTYAAGTTTASNLTVTGTFNAGDITNFKLTGGSNGSLLITDGLGNLSWSGAPMAPIPHITWTVNSNGTGQSFTFSGIEKYSNRDFLSVTRNGVSVRPNNYSIVGSTITFQNFLRVDDFMDILPTSPVIGGSGGGGSGTVTSVTGNGSGLGFSLTGTVSTTGNITLATPNAIDLRTNLGIGNIANGNLDGNTNNVVRGDGTLGVANYATWSGQTPGHWLPNGNVTWDLGSPTQRWRDIYLSNNTIYLGDTGNISSDANGVVINDASMGNLTVANILSANIITGEAGNLSNITGANVVGVVANATFATSAGSANSATIADSANSVAGANVSGVVANATFATSAGTANSATVADSANSVAGANVSGTVANATFATSAGSANSATVADSANAVTGANVSGTVANATFATSAGSANSATVADSANSVAGANVSGSVASSNVSNVANSVNLANVVGVGNIANINLDGNVSNVLTGGGTYVNRLGVTGNTREVLFNGNGTISSSNGWVFMTADPGSSSLQVIRQGTTSLFAGQGFANNAGTATLFSQRARGNVTSPTAVQVGDVLNGIVSFYNTGNGTGTATSPFGTTTGWMATPNLAPFINIDVQSLPSGAGTTAGTRIILRTTSNANVAYNTIINQDGNLFSPGNINATGNVTGANISGNIYAGGTVPATATSPGVPGQIVADGQYIYYCSATDTWVRAPLSTW